MKKYILVSVFIIYLLDFNFAQTQINPNAYNKLYYPNGSIQSEGLLVNGKPDGFWINYYPTGVKKSEGKRTNFKLDSTWVFYNIIGDTISKISYLNGKKNGFFIKYINKDDRYVGNINSRELYVNDKLEGIGIYYYPNGSIKLKVNYKDNKREGKAYEFSLDGRLISIYIYRKGFLTEKININRFNTEGDKIGVWQEFFDDYRLKFEANYKNGLLDGYYKEYDKSGALNLALLYRNGLLVEDVSFKNSQADLVQQYNSDSTVIKSGYFFDSKPIGIHKEFDKSGNITKALIYNNQHQLIESGNLNKDGLKTGVWEAYYSSGEVLSKGNYKNNLREGDWNFYFKNGTIEQKGNYLKGKYNGLWIWYYSNGEIWREEEYYRGKEEGKYIEYNILGDVIVEGEYFDGEKEGLWVTFVNDYKAEGNYVVGLKDGRWKHFYDNGNIAFEGNYIQGNPDGKHVYFYANGNLKEERFYNNGLKEKHWKKFNKFGELIITISYKNNEEYRINGVKVNLDNQDINVIE